MNWGVLLLQMQPRSSLHSRMKLLFLFFPFNSFSLPLEAIWAVSRALWLCHCQASHPQWHFPPAHSCLALPSLCDLLPAASVWTKTEWSTSLLRPKGAPSLPGDRHILEVAGTGAALPLGAASCLPCPALGTLATLLLPLGTWGCAWRHLQFPQPSCQVSSLSSTLQPPLA